jgi:hypothetical protein
MRKAQSTLEYTVVIVAVVAALLAMQIYLKRSMQGRLRQVADEAGQQYSPKATTSDITIQQESTVVTITNTTKDSGYYKTISTSNINQTDTRQGTETVGSLESSLYSP